MDENKKRERGLWQRVKNWSAKATIGIAALSSDGCATPGGTVAAITAADTSFKILQTTPSLLRQLDTEVREGAQILDRYIAQAQAIGEDVRNTSWEAQEKLGAALNKLGDNFEQLGRRVNKSAEKMFVETLQDVEKMLPREMREKVKNVRRSGQEKLGTLTMEAMRNGVHPRQQIREMLDAYFDQRHPLSPEARDARETIEKDRSLWEDVVRRPNEETRRR